MVLKKSRRGRRCRFRRAGRPEHESKGGVSTLSDGQGEYEVEVEVAACIVRGRGIEAFDAGKRKLEESKAEPSVRIGRLGGRQAHNVKERSLTESRNGSWERLARMRRQGRRVEREGVLGTVSRETDRGEQ